MLMSQRLIHMLLKGTESTEANGRVYGPNFATNLGNHCRRYDRGSHRKRHGANRLLKAIEISRAWNLLAQSFIFGVFHNSNDFELLFVLVFTKPAEFPSDGVAVPKEIPGHGLVDNGHFRRAICVSRAEIPA